MPSTPELAFDWKFFTRIPNGMIVYKELKSPPNGGKIWPRFHHMIQASGEVTRIGRVQQGEGRYGSGIVHEEFNLR